MITADAILIEARALYSVLEACGYKPFAKLDANKREKYLLMGEFNLRRAEELRRQELVMQGAIDSAQ